MVVSHRESSISSNIRAIIEQLNLNPVGTRRLLDPRVNGIDHALKQQQQQQQHQGPPSRARVTIGVYGLRQQVEGQLQIFRNEQQPTPRNANRKTEARPRQRIPARIDVDDEEASRRDEPAPPSGASLAEGPPGSPPRQDLPELKSGQLSHSAALHRISVRPRNRRPPRRGNSSGPPRPDGASEDSSDAPDSLEGAPDGEVGASPADRRPAPVLRQSSSGSRSSTAPEPEGPPAARRRTTAAAASPDSLEAGLDASPPPPPPPPAEPGEPPRPSPRSAEPRSPGRGPAAPGRPCRSPDSLEGAAPPDRLSKSSEGFDKLSDPEDASSTGRPVPAKRLLLQPISKSQERVCCARSSDSLEAALRALEAGGDAPGAAERRRSSFEIGPGAHKPVHKLMSKSTECFEATLHERQALRRARPGAELDKPARPSLSEVNLSRGGSRRGKLLLLLLSKSSESCDAAAGAPPAAQDRPLDGCWRPSRRPLHSSESSDNPELDDTCRLEQRAKERRRSAAAGWALGAAGSPDEQRSAVGPRRKLEAGSSLQRSSESSELGSTDTLDSERRNTAKSSDSEETLDSLERELQEQPGHHCSELDRRDEETTESILERREKLGSEQPEHDRLGSYWRRRADSHESRDSGNLDIHQLLAYSLVSRIAQENGNNDNVHRNNQQQHEEDKASSKTVGSTPLLVYPKKKLHQQHSQNQQSSSEENKTLSSTINNLLSSPNTDEDLQNMLNGNISEVSTDTKSFKEKLIMFEKLGK